MNEGRNTEKNVENAEITENAGDTGNAEKSEDATSSNATEPKRKQWHGPFFGSMRLELKGNKEGYVYAGEYPLNMKSLLIDMLARADQEVAWILDEITANFRKHNIIEFKSPDDDLNLDVFYKTVGYACLYKAKEKRVGEIQSTDISITFIRERKPEKLLKELEAICDVVESAPGIYQIKTHKILFPIQILVLREMEWRKHIWVTALQRKISQEHARVLLLEMEKLKYRDEREWANAVLRLVIANNIEIFEQLKEEETMCDALRELMQDELDGEKELGIKIGEARGIKLGAKILNDIIQRLRNGEEEESIRRSGVDEELLEMALGAV